MSFEGKSTYSIAVFHQMHCLVSPLIVTMGLDSDNLIKYTIMDRYNDLTGGPSVAQDDHNHHGNHRRQGSHSHNHVDHCFRYLRQSLLCCGDTALEGQDPNTNTTATDGTGAVHMCKDFEAIRLWAEDNRLVDVKHE